MRSSSISAIHYCIPERRLSSADLYERFGEKSVRSIEKMAGVAERRVVSPGETSSDLAFAAANALLTEKGISRESVDLLVFVSQTPDYQLPATACVLQHRLGLSEQCAAFDINLGCSAFPYGLAVAHSMISSGTANRALLLVADAITTIIHPQDRGLVPLHGDGGTAALIEPCPEGGGLLHFYLGTNGSGHKHLMVPASGARNPRNGESKLEVEVEKGVVRTAEHLHMNGPAIFHFSIYKVPEMISQALAKAQLNIEDFDLVLLHQANKTMVSQIYKSLGVPEEKRFYFAEQIGNCSGASTPILLAEAWRQGRIKPGSRTLLAAFGVGLSWGVAMVRWPENANCALSASVEYSQLMVQENEF